MPSRESVHNNIYLKILNFVSYKRRSEKEIDDHLSKYSERYSDFPDLDNIVSEIRSSLETDGYYNDVTFAEMYIDGCINSSVSTSPAKMRDFLYKKGISRELSESAMSRVGSEDVLKMAQRDGERKMKTLPDMSQKSLYSLKSYLYSKGYPENIIDSVVDTLANLK